MRVPLRKALESVLDGWQDDLPSPWREVASGTTLGFADMDQSLELDVWEPVFPARRGRFFPGAPKGAHIFRAFDGLAPEQVRCVVLGQDPYPCPAFSTGRAFEAGNVAEWRELNKMFSVSVRVFLQQICAARTGDDSYAMAFSEWPRLLREIEAGRVALEPASEIVNRWVGEGVLLLNSSLTLSRFKIEVDPHQRRGHVPVWRPFIQTVLRTLAARKAPLVCIGFGDVAADNLKAARIPEAQLILREHPAKGDQVLALENPFVLANRKLRDMGAAVISW